MKSKRPSKPAKRGKVIPKARRTKAKRAKAKVKPTAKAKPAAKARGKAGPSAPRTPTASKWTRFVAQHGVVLASARGPVPSVAEAIAGEPIVGSWWSHPKAQAIFDAMSAIDDDDDIGCFKLVDKKITFVHRRLWPALAKLAASGVLPADRVEAIEQEHMPTGAHRNVTVPFPDWVPEEVLRAAEALSIDEARAQLKLGS